MSTLPTADFVSGNKTLLRAMELANWIHRTQKDKSGDTPYIVHPFHGVALMSQCGFSVSNRDDLDVLVAECLHDGLEDCPREITSPEIEAAFGFRVRRLVESVTRDPVNPDKRASRKKILGLDWLHQSVKIGDVASNSMRLETLIAREGLEKAQGFFSKPLRERVKMEREFLMHCLPDGTPAPDHALRLQLLAIDSVKRLRVILAVD